MTRRILLTGGSGGLGKKLVPKLISMGHEVVILSKQSVPKDPKPGIMYVQVDITNKAKSYLNIVFSFFILTFFAKFEII